ncbi:MAG: SRPBCC domain-containing protein [Methylomonas sp.]|jgi:uncharacterized protein YndB with AHSA1/START domain
MKTTHESTPATLPEPLVVSRIFQASPAVVFQAWSSADHLKNWFCPAVYTVAEARVEFRAGGDFHICMRSPEGRDYWTKGKFVEISPHGRLVIDMYAVGEADAPLFRAYTAVTFTAVGGVTRMEVTQNYTLFEASAAQMIQGTPRGWGETLDKLEGEIARIRGVEPASRSVVHATF